MTSATLSRREPGAPWLVVLVGVSLGTHALAIALLGPFQRRPPPSVTRPMELVVVEVQRPAERPPDPPAPVLEQAPPTRPAPARARRTRSKPASRVVPPAPVDAPPPPEDVDPEEAPAATSPVRVVGISLSSTTTAGAFSVPVGNTAHGSVAARATAPSHVQRSAAPSDDVPLHQGDTEPVLLADARVYPDEARRAGIEGRVLLALKIDASGAVVAARVLKPAGHGLDEAALAASRRFRFKPATRGGAPVPTEIHYSYSFVLD